MNFDKIKQEISIVSYLKSIGCDPRFENDLTARFLAPYRADSKPSLSVNKLSNLWYDHGLGKGGNIIQLVALLNGCSDYDAGKMLVEKQGSSSFHCKPINELNNEPSYQITHIKDIGNNQALTQYLQYRAINMNIAKDYCKEVYYTLGVKKYFAVGFQNRSQSWELRNKYSKVCLGEKDITYYKYDSPHLSIFEGFTDFLSLKTINPSYKSDVLVLNTVSNLKMVKGLIKKYELVYLYFDNDNAGNIATDEMLLFDNCIDLRFKYRNYKDLNDFILSKK